MEAILLIVGLAVGVAVGWLLAASRLGRQSQAEREQRVAAETRLEEMTKQLEAQQSLLETARAQLSDSFKALSSDALQANSQAFVDRAKQALEPLAEALKRYEEHVRTLEQTRREDYGSLDAQIKTLMTAEEQLKRETGNLVNALRRPQVRGRWGEMTLRRAAELAGMSQYCDFEEQETLASDGGRLRPDMIVRLPAGRQVVVDAKCSLEAYLSAVEAQDEATRKTCLGQHCRQLREHMNSLASKSYQDQFASGLDLVVMFVPGESFLAAAMDEDPKLLEDGLQKKVLIASPINLIVLLKTAALGWREEQVTEHAQRISDTGRQLYGRLGNFVGYLQDVGKRLGGAAEAWNKMVGSWDSRLLPMARRFLEYGAATGDELPELGPVDIQLRELSAPEAEETR
jgi:DNA recombination protein RmuC